MLRLMAVAAATGLVLLCSCTDGRRPIAGPGDPSTIRATSILQPTKASIPPALTMTSTTTAVPSSSVAAVYTFPIRPATAAGYSHSHHNYPATDIFAVCGVTVVSPVTGTVQEVNRTGRWDRR